MQISLKRASNLKLQQHFPAPICDRPQRPVFEKRGGKSFVRWTPKILELVVPDVFGGCLRIGQSASGIFQIFQHLLVDDSAARADTVHGARQHLLPYFGQRTCAFYGQSDPSV
ncbi:hypothetical protein [Mandarin fish ranavirus]|nr:hypothetical protein [Mandarin fish ranavirus]